MALLLLAFMAGGLTILSPCILPVLPFAFARAGRPFHRRGLPQPAGMALSFSAGGTLAVVGGGLDRAGPSVRSHAGAGGVRVGVAVPAVADRFN
jgi:cytochrome c biogenesis protein CcdA